MPVYKHPLAGAPAGPALDLIRYGGPRLLVALRGLLSNEDERAAIGTSPTPAQQERIAEARAAIVYVVGEDLPQSTEPDPDATTRAIAALARHLGRDPDDIKAEHQLRGNLDADSLDIVELQFALEDEFDIELTDGALAAPGITVAGVLEALSAHGVQV